MRPARTAAIALVLAAAATAPAFGIASVSVYGLRAPEEISGFTLNDSTNFEKTKPGDGYGLDYSQSGWKLDVFIYDLKRAAIPDDAKSAIVRAEFERARADAFLAHPRGIYAQVYLRRNFTVEDGGKRTRFQCATFHMTRDGAKPQDGFLCVTSWNNKFVKLAPDDARRQQHRERRPQARRGLDPGAVGRRLAHRGGEAGEANACSRRRAPRAPRGAARTTRAAAARPAATGAGASRAAPAAVPRRLYLRILAERSQALRAAGRIAATASAILSGSATGSEQVSPTQMNAALAGPAAILACAG